MNPTYLIESTNGNARILKRQDDGTYSTIGFGAGPDNTREVLELARLANASLAEAQSSVPYPG